MTPDRFGPDAFLPTYGIPVVLGLVVTLLYPTSKAVSTDPHVKRGYRILLVVTIVFAVIGAKLTALIGDRGWPFWDDAGVLHAIIVSGRSITGGLLFGHVASEIARPLIGYTAPPNDRLAVAVCIGVAVGRIGCTLTGCCLGIPYDGPLALVDTVGIARFPAAQIDGVVQLALAALFFVFERRRLLYGRCFSLYMVLYGVFRFVIEPWRATPKTFGGLSLYQIVAIALVVVGAAGVAWRTRSPVWRARLSLDRPEVP